MKINCVAKITTDISNNAPNLPPATCKYCKRLTPDFVSGNEHTCDICMEEAPSCELAIHYDGGIYANN